MLRTGEPLRHPLDQIIDPDDVLFRMGRKVERTGSAEREVGGKNMRGRRFNRSRAPVRRQRHAEKEPANAPYVTTDGGMVAPYQGSVQDAKLLRLEVGETGRPPIEHA